MVGAWDMKLKNNANGVALEKGMNTTVHMILETDSMVCQVQNNKITEKTEAFFHISTSIPVYSSCSRQKKKHI